jgi:hypothetical protein
MADSLGHTKEALLQALEKSLGIVTVACKEAGISRDTHYRWLKEDPDYKAAVESLADVAIDFAESQLFKQIKGGVPASTIFYLKTKGKKRGYIEGQEVIQYNPDARPSWFDGSEIEG